ncbi:energy transducer TonB [Vogesella sp. GCM10023246]|uniref:Energy transducer TonB n=1 Tax=Vogesella oryzagri TaxID=3160864 RepID=A0ABV1M4D2_9NEIS
MLAARQPGVAAWLLSALLHVAVIAVLWWSAAPAVLHTPPPLAVELWAGGGAVAKAPAKPAATAAPVSKLAPAKALPTPAPAAQLPTLNSADITVKGGKPQRKPAPSPLPQDKAPTKKPLPPAPSKPAPAIPATKPAAAPPKPATKAAPPRTDDLLSELDDLPPGPGKGKVTQAGGKQGAQNGSASGVADLRAQYIDAVRNRIRPYVMVPDGISGNPEAVVEVEILPTLEIRSSRLLRSSGNSGYDQAVLTALREARRFPPLPKGAEFADFRRITLKFRPKE